LSFILKGYYPIKGEKAYISYSVSGLKNGNTADTGIREELTK
jgi:hypothetical protein